MDVKVQLNNIRIAPRKSRQVVDLIRGKKVGEAQALLEFTVKRASDPILKLLNSAVASAEHNFQLKNENLFISKVTVDEGPKLKRMHPMSRGRGYAIMKRTSRITLVVSELPKQGAEKETKKAVPATKEEPAKKAAPKKAATKKSNKKEA